MRNLYKLISIERVYKGRYATIRSYQRDEAYRKCQGIKIKLKLTGEIMTVEHKDLKKGIENLTPLSSNHVPGQKYFLVDYDWKPDKKEEQISLFADNKDHEVSILRNYEILSQIRAITQKKENQSFI